MNTGFSTSHLSEEEKRTFISNINISLIEEEPAKQSIVCFDVNTNEMIAIGQNYSEQKMICIYSSDGVYQYGYTFNCSGNFCVEWDENNLNIYFVRSAVIVSVDSKGKILDVLEVQNTIENNSYRNHFAYSTERIVNDKEYALRNDMGILNVFASSYSQLVVTNSIGEETILYDLNSAQFIKYLTICILVSVLFLFAVAIIIWQLIKLKKNI